MKPMKLFSLLLALVLALGCLTACGSDSTAPKSGDAELPELDGGNGGGASIVGSEQTWGNYTMLVPEDMEMKGGNLFDEEDPDVVNVHVKDNEFKYFLFNVYSEEGCKSSIEGTKDFNEGAQDVTLTTGDVTWTGVAYDSYGTPAFQMYGVVNGKYILVGSYSYEYDSETTKAILSSLKVQ